MHLFLAEFGQVGAIHLLGQIDFAVVGGRGGGALLVRRGYRGAWRHILVPTTMQKLAIIAAIRVKVEVVSQHFDMQ